MAAFLRKSATLEASFRLVLASGSPRRRELLQILGVPFDVINSGFPEDLDKSRYEPEAYVVANAREKCVAVARSLPTGDTEDARPPLVIGADTVVSVDGRILEKPLDREAARAMLSSLSGREHRVFTGIAIARPGGSVSTLCECTYVKFRELTPEDITAYMDTGEPFDKAGGYGIQSKGSLLVEEIRGDYFNVVGLPLSGLSRLLSEQLPEDECPSSNKRPRVEGAPAASFIDKLALVLVRERKQLVARTRGKSAFFTPGGKREKGETDEEALIREVKEELSVDLVRDSIRPYGVFQAQAHGKPEGTLVRMTCYTADLSGEIAPSNEIEELKWITSDFDASLLSVTGVMILEDLKKKDVVD